MICLLLTQLNQTVTGNGVHGRRVYNIAFVNFYYKIYYIVSRVSQNKRRTLIGIQSFGRFTSEQKQIMISLSVA